MKISHEKFGAFFRGVIRKAQEMRFTLQVFEDGEDAELYTLSLVMRWRSIFHK